MKKVFKIEVDCAHCANKMEECASKVKGVRSAAVSFMTLKMTVDFEAPIQDAPETIRNFQFVDYVLHKSRLDDKIDELTEKVKGFFKKS